MSLQIKPSNDQALLSQDLPVSPQPREPVPPHIGQQGVPGENVTDWDNSPFSSVTPSLNHGSPVIYSRQSAAWRPISKNIPQQKRGKLPIQPKIRHQGALYGKGLGQVSPIPPSSHVAPSTAAVAPATSSKLPSHAQAIQDQFQSYFTNGNAASGGIAGAYNYFNKANQNFQNGAYLDGLYSSYIGFEYLLIAAQGALNVSQMASKDAGFTEQAKMFEKYSSQLLTTEKLLNGFSKPLHATRSFLETYSSPTASKADKKNAAISLISIASRRIGEAILAYNKAIANDSEFVDRLATTLKHAGRAGNFSNDLQSSFTDFDTAYRQKDGFGMLNSSAAILYNGTGLTQVFTEILGKFFKDAGLKEQAAYFDRLTKNLDDLNTIADGLGQQTQFLQTITAA